VLVYAVLRVYLARENRARDRATVSARQHDGCKGPSDDDALPHINETAFADLTDRENVK
jgi:predicted transcriptional regulator